MFRFIFFRQKAPNMTFPGNSPSKIFQLFPFPLIQTVKKRRLQRGELPGRKPKAEIPIRTECPSSLQTL